MKILGPHLWKLLIFILLNVKSEVGQQSTLPSLPSFLDARSPLRLTNGTQVQPAQKQWCDCSTQILEHSRCYVPGLPFFPLTWARQGPVASLKRLTLLQTSLR